MPRRTVREVIMEETIPYGHRPKFDAPLSISNYCHDHGYHLESQEVLRVFLLDTKRHLLRDSIVTVGLVNSSQVHAREVFRRAIAMNATSLIVVHNHPSGSTEPSSEDSKLTRDLDAAGKIIGINVLDHVVIGENGFFSFREQGLLS